MKLDIVRPFKAHNVASSPWSPGSDSTRVTWAMHGPQPYLAKLMGTFINCDKMMGGHFEKGLANLKVLAEGELRRAS